MQHSMSVYYSIDCLPCCCASISRDIASVFGSHSALLGSLVPLPPAFLVLPPLMSDGFESRLPLSRAALASGYAMVCILCNLGDWATICVIRGDDSRWVRVSVLLVDVCVFVCVLFMSCIYNLVFYI